MYICPVGEKWNLSLCVSDPEELNNANVITMDTGTIDPSKIGVTILLKTEGEAPGMILLRGLLPDLDYNVSGVWALYIKELLTHSSPCHVPEPKAQISVLWRCQAQNSSPQIHFYSWRIPLGQVYRRRCAR